MITVRISEGDFLKSQWLHSKVSIFRFFGVILIVAWLGYLLYEVFEISRPAVIGGVLGFLVWNLFYYVIYLRLRYKKIYRQQKKFLHSPTNVLWNEEFIEFRDEVGHVKLKWSDYAKYREGKYIVLLYLSDVLFHMIPKSAFESEEQMKDFMSHINSNTN